MAERISNKKPRHSGQAVRSEAGVNKVVIPDKQCEALRDPEPTPPLEDSFRAEPGGEMDSGSSLRSAHAVRNDDFV
jgi:hypothetical protein